MKSKGKCDTKVAQVFIINVLNVRGQCRQWVGISLRLFRMRHIVASERIAGPCNCLRFERKKVNKEGLDS